MRRRIHGPTETIEQLVDLEEHARAAVNLARRTRFACLGSFKTIGSGLGKTMIALNLAQAAPAVEVAPQARLISCQPASHERLPPDFDVVNLPGAAAGTLQGELDRLVGAIGAHLWADLNDHRASGAR